MNPMKRLYLLALILLACGSSSSMNEQPVSEQPVLIGTWHLTTLSTTNTAPCSCGSWGRNYECLDTPCDRTIFLDFIVEISPDGKWADTAGNSGSWESDGELLTIHYREAMASGRYTLIGSLLTWVVAAPILIPLFEAMGHISTVDSMRDGGWTNPVRLRLTKVDPP